MRAFSKKARKETPVNKCHARCNKEKRERERERGKKNTPLRDTCNFLPIQLVREKKINVNFMLKWVIVTRLQVMYNCVRKHPLKSSVVESLGRRGVAVFSGDYN